MDQKHGALYNQEAFACGALTGFGRVWDLPRPMPMATLRRVSDGNRKSGDFRPLSGTESRVRITPFTWSWTPVSGRFLPHRPSPDNFGAASERRRPADDGGRAVAVVQLVPANTPARRPRSGFAAAQGLVIYGDGRRDRESGPWLTRTLRRRPAWRPIRRAAPGAAPSWRAVCLRQRPAPPACAAGASIGPICPRRPGLVPMPVCALTAFVRRSPPPV